MNHVDMIYKLYLAETIEIYLVYLLPKLIEI